ncbi:TadE/TadG family type IV pilus assembly protein [Desulfurivibrio sp. C05AmB]|uniref:TadE/TadG family type IV pilus assembly protein n=1 Tax=Desulfurivibrio sp. C05AmB TaxID=3374371 RepID=UPI00376F1AA5
MNRMPWRKTPLRAKVERGATMVEFAIVIVVFMVLVMGGFEFGRMIFEWGRVVEATRAGVRMAVVSTPPVGCRDANGNLTLTDGSCGPVNPDAGSDVLLAMQRILPTIERDNIELTYTSTIMGSPLRSVPIPVVTVEVQGLTFEPVVAGLLGLPTTIPIPGFASSQTGESLRDLN